MRFAAAVVALLAASALPPVFAEEPGLLQPWKVVGLRAARQEIPRGFRNGPADAATKAEGEPEDAGRVGEVSEARPQAALAGRLREVGAGRGEILAERLDLGVESVRQEEPAWTPAGLARNGRGGVFERGLAVAGEELRGGVPLGRVVDGAEVSAVSPWLRARTSFQ